MKTTEQMMAEAEKLVATLFANGGSPMTKFGTSWEQLEQLELRDDQITSIIPCEVHRQVAYG
ncbi:hypothetical protein [Pantoea sp. PNT03]|uniref:hypothetical protein n=1 Tax=Pantoea sp. PNT03 TaxID=2769258 RepID=UPI001784DC23|nr:hypothetical protein [Pantoea sp. PNT03]MBD9658071.1 hypothetical protein [Pantoea sp. PNT03]